MRHVVAVFVAGLFAASAMAADARPNILLCVADDWSFPHAGCYGDKVVKTPNFDKFATEGTLFTNSYCVVPSCTASRAAMLTGQPPHRLEDGANLWGILPQRFPTLPDQLEKAGYAVGHTGKGWGPGSLEGSGRTRNPAGPSFKGFDEFLKQAPGEKPFYFWYGSHRPHRPYKLGSGKAAGLSADAVTVPAYLPDSPEVRGDILDYYAAVQEFDRELGDVLKRLDASGRANNTFVIVTSDNGWPFPRCKANLYDGGMRMPLAVRWPARGLRGVRSDDPVSHLDIAPTIFAAVGLPPSPDHVGRTRIGRLIGEKFQPGGEVYYERERHANVRQGDLSYPSRAVRTSKFLYIRNLRPDRWPGGDPERYFAVGRFGDCDPGPAKDYIIEHRDDAKVKRFFELAFAKRPAEELYDVTTDPYQLVNVASRPELADVKSDLRGTLDEWMKRTNDPRVNPADDRFDKFRYFGQPTKEEKEK
jgi:N-sulfoglucosamine sulfohydrolase